MLESFVIIGIGLLPALFSLALMRKAETQAQESLQSALHLSTHRGMRRFPCHFTADHHYVEGVGYMVGDITCRYNARSAYIRCAVNPDGPCQECSQYESIEFKEFKEC